MTKEIVKYPNPILREKSQEVKEITEEIKKLGLDMAETMIENQGLGLAASQIGELKKIAVFKFENNPLILINPKITKKSKETEVGEEGCLSFPGLYLKIKRAKEIETEALNINSQKIKIKTEGLLARVFQHEIDHLDGILFIDRISFFQKLWRLLKN